ncbi:hypothetical protein KIN20_009518 [Parelaphostrongylus tenuis]|uniref:Uncharacterized protein n=1 Tax=Parelaphostrongylus tenuis TaxID=148309 RepID=A0AAD5M6H0_PARTN|nr:hypothetical protein KIN20_009518 [Parelaphostrongylus tenuis]
MTREQCGGRERVDVGKINRLDKKMKYERVSFKVLNYSTFNHMSINERTLSKTIIKGRSLIHRLTSRKGLATDRTGVFVVLIFDLHRQGRQLIVRIAELARGARSLLFNQGFSAFGNQATVISHPNFQNAAAKQRREDLTEKEQHLWAKVQKVQKAFAKYNQVLPITRRDGCSPRP